MKRLLLFLLLVPLAFAQWEGIAAGALTVSIILLAIAYAVGLAFGVNELQMMAKEELYQVVAAGLMVAVLLGANGLLNGVSNAMAFEPGTTTMQAAAVKLLTDTGAAVTTDLRNIGQLDMDVTREASKSGSCNIIQVGYGLSGCGGYSMLPTPLSMAGGITGFAVGELAAMKRLIEISQHFALSFLLPLGIILRTFKVTRGAGGFLIALGISMHLALPAGVLFSQMLSVTFYNNTAASAGYTGAPSASVPSCEPMDSDPSDKGTFSCGSLSSSGKNDEKAAYAYCSMKADIRHYVNDVLIKAILGPVIALLMFAASLRALTSIAGAEVDVSAISRFV